MPGSGSTRKNGTDTGGRLPDDVPDHEGRTEYTELAKVPPEWIAQYGWRMARQIPNYFAPER